MAAGMLALLCCPALAELQVSASPEQIPPAALGDSRVWNAYVTVTVLRDGRPGEGATVELRGASGAVASGRADASGRAVLPLLSREPDSFEVWVDGADSGRRVVLEGRAGPSTTAPPLAVPAPGGGGPGWVAAVALAGVAALIAIFAVKKRFKPKG
ncbi:MAG: hypothetical protein QXT68_08105 [Halobacteria archaeon]